MATIKLNKVLIRSVVKELEKDLEKSRKVVAEHVVGKTYTTGFIFKKTHVVKSYEHWINDVRFDVGYREVVWKYTNEDKELDAHFEFHDFVPGDIYRLKHWWKMADIAIDGNITVDIDDWVFRRTLEYFKGNDYWYGYAYDPN